ncbi:hypothetical protein RP726_01860 [Candidatus Methylospira mobilis]|uniref:flavin reductase family protein n=1 Tax=Candidatus Methylospira mobilis TaxID=1808979 RepID=UPI001D1707B6|nr:hypothetical protein [Candidatus Methylospira mobilis]WNV05167.1 hypothetical protein RP726_01860 [Candidatus Methylospira mobilis]
MAAAIFAPISSVFWLGWRCLLGLAAVAKTMQNLIRTGEWVFNLPSVNEVEAVNRPALTTGSDPVPEFKRGKGYRHEADKFGVAGLTPMVSETAAPARVRECPVQLEANVAATHRVGENNPAQRGIILCIETRVQRVHADSPIMMSGEHDRIDPDKWRPLTMSFQQFYGLGPQFQGSVLGTIPEAMYRSPDMESARHPRLSP